QAEDGIRDFHVTGVQTCALPIFFQGFAVAMMLEGMNNSDMGGGRFGDVVADPGWSFRLLTIITLTTGTALLMWLGEQATERGIRSEERRVGQDSRSRWGTRRQTE